jgi:hypothetical protein
MILLIVNAGVFFSPVPWVKPKTKAEMTADKITVIATINITPITADTASSLLASLFTFDIYPSPSTVFTNKSRTFEYYSLHGSNTNVSLLS